MARFDLFGDPSRNTLRELWDRLEPLPGGRRLFSWLVGRAAPYTGTIRARVEVLRDGYAEAVMDDRPRVRNHLRSVHAIALVNLAELAGNAALVYSMPPDARFIVTGISMEYLKKARGRIRAVAHCPVPESNERAELEFDVSLRDEAGDEVARARVRSLVGPKPKA